MSTCLHVFNWIRTGINSISLQSPPIFKSLFGQNLYDSRFNKFSTSQKVRKNLSLMLNSYMVLHMAYQILHAHDTAAYEEEGNGVSLDVHR